MSTFKGKASLVYNSVVLRGLVSIRYSKFKKTQDQSYSEFVPKYSGLFNKWVASHQIRLIYRVTGNGDLTGHKKMGYQLAYVLI